MQAVDFVRETEELCGLKEFATKLARDEAPRKVKPTAMPGKILLLFDERHGHDGVVSDVTSSRQLVVRKLLGALGVIGCLRVSVSRLVLGRMFYPRKSIVESVRAY